MSWEVVHSSVARGLRGETGFATAIVTRGLPAGLESGLQDVSGYDHDAVRAIGADEIEWAHRIVTVRGRPYTVLSRIGPNGVDASRRPNRIAHHLVLEPQDRAAAGPAWMLGQYTRFETGTPEVTERERPPVLPEGDLPARPATAWQFAGHDPGWAGLVAQAVLDAPQATVYVVLPRMTDVLPLAVDVFALLPADRRWHVTFSTRPLALPPHVRCQLRFVREDSPGLARLLAEPGVREIRVELGSDAGDGPAAVAARRGAVVEPSTRPMSTRVHPVLGAAGGVSRAVGDWTSGDEAGRSPSSAALESTGMGAAPSVLLPGEQRPRDTAARMVAPPPPRSSESFRWPRLAVVLSIYAVLASLGALILFLLAAIRR